MNEILKGSSGAKKGEVTPARDVWQPLTSLQNEMNRLFDDFTGGWHGWPMPRLFEPTEFPKLLGEAGPISPRVDVSESDKAITVTAELPGMDEKDIEVVLSDGVLRIKGEKKEEAEDKKKDYYMMERRYGSFQRAFRLPEEVDDKKVSAAFSKGVLRVTVPKSAKAEAKLHKVKIKSG